MVEMTPWGQPEADFVPIALGLAVVFAAFMVAAFLYLRAINAVVNWLKENKSDEWRRRQSSVSAYVPPQWGWRYRQALMFRAPDIPDDSYRRLLWAARNRLLIVFVLFAIFIVGLGWATQGTSLHG
jgi:hypothetical protein